MSQYTEVEELCEDLLYAEVSSIWMSDGKRLKHDIFTYFKLGRIDRQRWNCQHGISDEVKILFEQATHSHWDWSPLGPPLRSCPENLESIRWRCVNIQFDFMD